MEMGNFDTQVLKAKEEGKPLPHGADYQHGERYGIATLREAVFSRDGYKCQCCGKTISDGAILHVHHIKYRSRGGTNSMTNLATVCDKCHTPKNHKPGGKLYNWKPKLPNFKGATAATTIRWQALQ
ncbi:MAG: HNH endonuclease [Anaerobutyricum sp.]